MLLSLWQALQNTLSETQSLLLWHRASWDCEQPSLTGLPPAACPGLPPEPPTQLPAGETEASVRTALVAGSLYLPGGPKASIFSLLPAGHTESPAPCFPTLSSPPTERTVTSHVLGALLLRMQPWAGRGQPWVPMGAWGSDLASGGEELRLVEGRVLSGAGNWARTPVLFALPLR